MVSIAKAKDALAALLNLTDAKRLLRISFPQKDGPKAELLVNSLIADESLSRDFTFTAELLSDRDNIPLKEIIGKRVCIELLHHGATARYFSGYCFGFKLTGIKSSCAVYEMTLKPWTNFLKLHTDYYLFHNQSIIDQTKEIFADYGMAVADIKVANSGGPRTMSCQYGESDYNYLHRRWEEMGWCYWYEHDATGHVLVLHDNSCHAAPIGGDPNIAYHHAKSSNSEDKITRWSPERGIIPGIVTVVTTDFKFPPAKMARYTTRHDQGGIEKQELYQYTGHYGFGNRAEGEELAQRGIEALDASAKHFDATSSNRFIMPGHWFCPVDHNGEDGFGGDGDNIAYLITAATHTITNNLLSGEGKPASHSNDFTCIRRMVRWVPPRGRNSIDTKAHGTDTAVVTGPKGEEIHTDQYGRVTVQFHWDRVGQRDEKSSAWMRVATTWAGRNFGAISLPRIGEEVIISYLQSDPDKPYVSGSFYNHDNMPPWDLPANKTQSGVLTRSSKGGSAANANSLRFEDKKGEEEIWLRAEKNQRIEVENDESHWVGHDRTKTVDHDETVHVKNDRTETVDHDENITVHNNRTERVDHDEKTSIGDNRTEDVGKNEDIDIGANRSVTIGKNKTETVAMAKIENVGMAKLLTIGGLYQTSVGAAMNTTVALSQSEEVGHTKTVLVGQKFIINAGDELEITVGKSSITMRADGRIDIIGDQITISGSKKVEIHGDDVDVNPS